MNHIEEGGKQADVIIFPALHAPNLRLAFSLKVEIENKNGLCKNEGRILKMGILRTKKFNISVNIVVREAGYVGHG